MRLSKGYQDSPNAVHLLAVPVDERGDGVGRAHNAAHAQILVMVPLELSCGGTR